MLALTQGDANRGIHSAYLEAGADIVETNTFGATSVALADFGLQHHTPEMNLVAAGLARAAADAWTARTPDRPRFVAGSIGPTVKTLSISPDVNNPAFRAITFDEMRDAFPEIAEYSRWRDRMIYQYQELGQFIASQDYQGLDPETIQNIYTYKVGVLDQVPDYFELQDQYYDLPAGVERRSFLAQHPELKDAWEWKRQFLAFNPSVIKYVKDDSDLAEGVLICTLDHRVLLYNHAALGLLHVAGELVLGRSLFNLVAREPVVHALERLIAEGGPGEAREDVCTVVCTTADATRLLLGRLSLTREESGRPTGWWGSERGRGAAGSPLTSSHPHELP